MSMQHDYNLAVEYIARYGCSHWGENKETIEDCGGWQLTAYDTWHKCPLHYNKQPHPEDC